MSFIWPSYEEVEQFFRDIRLLEYTPENQRNNNFRSRDSWEYRLWDAWGHCFQGAATTRDLRSERVAWLLGTGAEVLHEGLARLSVELLPKHFGRLPPTYPDWLPTWPTMEHDSFVQDTFNQAVGRSIGTAHPRGNFARLSFDAMVQGRLDLTLAGIPRGTVLRRIREAQSENAASMHQRMVRWYQRRARSGSREV